MHCQYGFTGTSTQGQDITGTVTLDSTSVTNNNIHFDIVAFALECDGTHYAGNDGYLLFQPAENPAWVICNRGGTWAMGAWNNDDTGVVFRNLDESVYAEPESGSGYAFMYGHLPPRMGLNGDNVLGGPFQPAGWVELTWIPTTEASDGPSRPGDLNIRIQ